MNSKFFCAHAIEESKRSYVVVMRAWPLCRDVDLQPSTFPSELFSCSYVFIRSFQDAVA